jgi:hypothetical protein
MNGLHPGRNVTCADVEGQTELQHCRERWPSAFAQRRWPRTFARCEANIQVSAGEVIVEPWYAFLITNRRRFRTRRFRILDIFTDAETPCGSGYLTQLSRRVQPGDNINVDALDEDPENIFTDGLHFFEKRKGCV